MSKRVTNEPVTKSHSVDNYARRQTERLADATNEIFDAAPFVSLWGVKTFAVNATIPDTVTDEDFTPEAGQPDSLAGATKLIVTVEGIHSSAGATVAGNKQIRYKVIDSEDKVCAWLYDTNLNVTNEVFKAMPDMDGTYFEEISCFSANGTTYVNNTSNNASYYTKAVGHRETGEIMVSPKVKSLEISFGVNKVAYSTPLVIKIYAAFD